MPRGIIMDELSLKLSNVLYVLKKFSEKKANTKAEIIEIPTNITPDEAVKKIPILIGNGFGRLQEIKKQVDDANAQAELASEAARNAWLKPTGFWKRTTPAIEALQQAVMSQSKAQVQLSKAQCLMFEQQQILANYSKFLFSLCVVNLTCARMAVKEISMRLQEASEEEISDIAKQEMAKVLEQLKQQMDILEKQERLQNKIHLLENRIDGLEEYKKSAENQLINYQNELYQAKEQQNTSVAHLQKKGIGWESLRRFVAVLLVGLGIHYLYNRRWIMSILGIFIAFLLWGKNDESPQQIPEEKVQSPLNEQ